MLEFFRFRTFLIIFLILRKKLAFLVTGADASANNTSFFYVLPLSFSFEVMPMDMGKYIFFLNMYICILNYILGL